MAETLINAIDSILPQTQCRRCGFDGCLPYAGAIAQQQAPINRCPPGGREVIASLAQLLGRDAIDPDPECGEQQPYRTAFIVAEHCIGCTKCIVACPLDAIIGAPKRMHTVIPELCSGCDLCVPACPVDCIEMVEDPVHRDWTESDAAAARTRHRNRAVRLEREKLDERRRLERKAVRKLSLLEQEPADETTARKRLVIEAAIRKARERLALGPAEDASGCGAAGKTGAPGSGENR